MTETTETTTDSEQIDVVSINVDEETAADFETIRIALSTENGWESFIDALPAKPGRYELRRVDEDHTET